jgi:hypothetical protein
MDSCNDTRCRVGCPIRISTDQRLLAAPRGFSQRATSFIASWCQGIHRMPFLYSISRTLFPRDQPRRSSLTMHRNHPQRPPACLARRLSETTATATTGGWKTVLEISFHSAPPGPPPGQAGWQWPTQGMHNRILSHGRSAARSRGAAKDPSDKIVHNASEPSPPAGGVVVAAPECFAFKRGTAIPGQTYDRTAHQISGARCHRPRPDQSATPMHRHLLMTRPETHQNLIHLDKEQPGRRSSRSNGAATRPGRYARTRVHTELGHSAILGSVARCPFSGFRKNTPATGDGKPGAGPAAGPGAGMETIGIEPTTPCLQSRCSPS